MMPGLGFHLGPKVTDEQQTDIALGFRIAKEISRLDIGQMVIVKKGTILAVEALEGTDKCLARGGELAGTRGGAVAVKVAKEQHDMRFDVPCVGPETLKACAASGIDVLAVEAGKTLILEQEIAGALAREKKVSVTTVGASSREAN